MTKLEKAGNESANVASVPDAIIKQEAALPANLVRLPDTPWEVRLCGRSSNRGER
jgi:hypothetical protein